MTRNLRIISTILLFSLFTKTAVYSQANVASSNGYTVHIDIQPVSIIPSGNSCQYGYNYNVNLHYSVSFTGSNIPASLYTLQGTIGCGSSSHFYDLPNNGGSGNVTTQSNVWNPHPDCATATPATLLCNTAAIQIDGPGIAPQTVIITLPVGGPLAIKLNDFNAEAQKEKVKITWSTAIENNNDYFSVERSTDAAIWTVVKTIKVAANSTSLINYESFDEKPVMGTAYYRLKQTDLDGKFTYSTSRVVKFTAGDNIYAYPIPNPGNTVNFRGIVQPKNIELAVHNISGNKVFTTTLQTNKVELPLLKSGMYLMTLNNKLTGEITNIRYVKL
jgi:hypothetical protein